MTQVVALIPARSGSKGIPHKNIRDLCGKPLLAHAIEQARACPLIARVIVSTDSERYAEIARRYGAETPFLRPAGISEDLSTDFEVFDHALRWLAANEDDVPDLLVHLRPTHPNRTPQQITEAVTMLRENPELDAVRSVVRAPETPFKMWFCQQDELTPVVTTGIREAHSLPRQALPQAYLQNAAIDVIRTKTILELKSMTGRRVGAYHMDELHDIDSVDQFSSAAAAIRWADGMPRNKTFVVDIDGVIASLTSNNDYHLCFPIRENIDRVNRLYAADNRIVLFTARGSLTGIDWRQLTERQLREWDVRHHELRFGKPAADYYVDDRALTLFDLATIDSLKTGA